MYANPIILHSFAKVMFLQVSVCPPRGGGGMHGFIWGGVVLFGGHAWFYLGGVWFYLGEACMFFSVFSDTMRYGQ